MNVLDLFSGIGGISLGLERAGMKTVGFCEIDKECIRILRKHWKEVPIYYDVCKLTKDNLNEKIDVIAGGFPCQDLSVAGNRKGLQGERSGLWWEFHRLIKEIQPKYAIIENVAAIRSSGLEQVLCSLNEIGYDAEWHCIPATYVGAPHSRDRIWIVSYPKHNGSSAASQQGGNDKNVRNCKKGSETTLQSSGVYTPCLLSSELAGFIDVRNSKEFWRVESRICRVADGIPNRVHRIKQLGNSVVPQIPEILGRAIIKRELYLGGSK